MQAGSLIRLTRKPTDSPTAQETMFWCEKQGMSVLLPIGSVGVVVDPSARSAVGNEITIFMMGEELYSICKYTTLRREGGDIMIKQLWCEVIDGE